jgi:hypothetical protein
LVEEGMNSISLNPMPLIVKKEIENIWQPKNDAKKTYETAFKSRSVITGRSQVGRPCSRSKVCV